MIKKIHKNCKHFKNGICTLKNKEVNPEGPACPSFNPISLSNPGSKNKELKSLLAGHTGLESWGEACKKSLAKLTSSKYPRSREDLVDLIKKGHKALGLPCPGSKIRSFSKGQGLGTGKGKGPLGIPFYSKPKPWQRFIRASQKKIRSNPKRMSLILLGDITRLLRTVRNLKGRVYIVGGVVTEGSSVRDLDIVVTDTRDISKIKKSLGKYAPRAHFLVQKGEPPAILFVKITGKEPKSPDLNKKGKIKPNEYAVSS